MTFLGVDDCATQFMHISTGATARFAVDILHVFQFTSTHMDSRPQAFGVEFES